MSTVTDDTIKDAVRARLLEAARTERLMPASRLRPAAARSAWPSVLYSAEDVAGWKVEPDERAAAAGRRGLTAGEVSRWEECLSWLAHVQRIEDREALTAWVRCTVFGRSFRSWCRKNGIEEQKGGHRRVEYALRDVVAGLQNNADLWDQLLRRGVTTNAEDLGTHSGMLAERDAAAPEPVTTHFMDLEAYEAWAAPLPDYSDPEQAAATERAIEEHNERMRRRAARLAKLDPTEVA